MTYSQCSRMQSTESNEAMCYNDNVGGPSRVSLKKDVWCSSPKNYIYIYLSHHISSCLILSHCGHPFSLLYGCSSVSLMA